MKLIKNNLKLIVVVAIAAGLFFGGYWFKSNSGSFGAGEQTTQQKKEYYISFDDYYFEVPKQKAVDDKLVVGAQFLYNLNTSIKANSLDSLFNDGAIGVQALIPLNGNNQAFERYLNDVSKPAAASALSGTADLSFSNRKDGVRAADLVSKKDNQIIRRQYIVNLPQSVAVVSQGDSEAFKAIGKTIGQASVKFSDYENVKYKVLAQSSMLKNRMLEDIYAQAHEDLKDASSVDELSSIALRSKDLLELEAKISGVKISKNEMTATILFIDSKNPTKNLSGSLVFRKSEGQWKLFTLQLPNGSVTGVSQDEQKQ